MVTVRAYEDGGGFGGRFDQTLAAAKAGGDWAWRELYRGTAPALARYLRARGVPDVEDIVGETFLRVVRHLDGFAGDEAAFRTWLFTIARHLVVDGVRRRERRSRQARELAGGAGAAVLPQHAQQFATGWRCH